MKKTVSVTLFLGAFCCALFTVLATNNNGIHNISTTAVYLEGEACIVNVNNRTTEELERDLHGCALFHDILATK